MVEIIAEFGSNPAPAWDFDRWCLEACLAGATHVKVQLWRAGHFPDEEWADKIPLEFPHARYQEFVEMAHRYGLKAGASAFDGAAARLLRYGDFGKIALREYGDDRLLWSIEDNVEYVYESCPVNTKRRGYRHLGCIPEYSTPMPRAMLGLLRWAWNSRHARTWGWSSHTKGIADCVMAVALGATVIEKHFALTPQDVEAGHSLLPSDFARMARKING